jgi:hypothetical protein
VGVGLVGLAVSGPARVGDADSARADVRVRPSHLLHRRHPPGALPRVKRALVAHADPRRVIPPILQNPKTPKPQVLESAYMANKLLSEFMPDLPCLPYLPFLP